LKSFFKYFFDELFLWFRVQIVPFNSLNAFFAA
jgi:hypothetical protein